MKTAVVTDSNSGISRVEAEQLGTHVLPMPFFINDELFYEDVTMNQKQFFEKLTDDSVDVKTSQPSPGEVLDFWDALLKEYDEIVYIPMSSGLSNSCETAKMLAVDYDGKVQVVDNRRISITMRRSVIDALNLVKQGKTAAEIREILEEEASQNSIYISLDTLKYLKKGGRITSAAAVLGTVLNIKPVLQIQGAKLDAYAKVRGGEMAKKKMLDAIRVDLENRFNVFPAEKLHVDVAYAGDRDAAEKWLEEVKAAFPGFNDIHMAPLSLSVSCHIGPGALAVAVSKSI